MDNFYLEKKKDLKQTREEAIASGNAVYWNGNPCANGHVTFRRVGNYRCVTCARLSTRKTMFGDELDQEAVTIRRSLEDRPRKPKDEYDYDL